MCPVLLTTSSRITAARHSTLYNSPWMVSTRRYQKCQFLEKCVSSYYAYEAVIFCCCSNRQHGLKCDLLKKKKCDSISMHDIYIHLSWLFCGKMHRHMSFKWRGGETSSPTPYCNPSTVISIHFLNATSQQQVWPLKAFFHYIQWSIESAKVTSDPQILEPIWPL